MKTIKVIRKTVSPILNIALPLFISKLAGLALKSQPVKSKFLQSELRSHYEILYMFSNIQDYCHPKFHAKISKNEKVKNKTQEGRFFLHTL